MRNCYKKAISFVVALSVCIPVFAFAGCGKKNVDIMGSLKDAPWYDSVSVLIDDSYDRTQYSYVDSRVIGVVDDTIIAVISSQKHQDPSELSYDSDLTFCYYDMKGEITDEINVVEMIAEYKDAGDLGKVYTDSYDIVLRGDKLYIDAYAVGINSKIILCFDAAKKEIVSHELSTQTARLSFEVPKEYEGYSIKMSMEEKGAIFTVGSPEGKSSDIFVSEQIPGFGTVTAVINYIYLGEGKLLSYVSMADYTKEKLIIDLHNATIQPLNNTSEYDWLDVFSDSFVGYFEGCGNVVADDYGIRTIDLDEKKTEQIVTYDECNVNRDDMTQMALVYMDEKNIVFSGIVMRGGYLATDDYETYNLDVTRCEMIILTKADKNPHEGKLLLKAAYMNGSMSYATAEAIRLFNEQSQDAFIVTDLRYSKEALVDQIGYDLQDSEAERERKENAAFITALTVDLMCGDGPDIIFGTMENTQLNTPELLLDLNGCVNREECFTNVIDSAMTGDALYQLPLCFSVDGILTIKENAPSNGKGFTFDEYEDFISGPCNGNEPTDLDKLEFFDLCLRNMSDQFNNGGNYDFDNEAFRQLAEFTSANVFDHYDEERSSAEDFLDTSVPVASYTRICSAKSILRKVHGPIDEYALLGLASVDGRGPIASVRDSVAISASTSAPDACLEFVSLLTGQEFQRAFAHNCALPINRDAFIEESYQVIKDTNELYENYYSLYFTPGEMSAERVPSVRLDEDKFVDTLLSYVDSASGIGFIDSPVQIIIYEEIQPYFAGQKSIDDTIPIIENRVNLYAAERQN